MKQFFLPPRCILFLKKKKSSNNRPKQSEINYFLSRSIDHSKQGKHRIKLRFLAHLKRLFYFTRTILEEGWRIRARVREVDNGKDFIQKRHMSRQRYPVQAAIRPSQFSLPAAFERNTTPSLPPSAGCIFKSYHTRDISRRRPLYSLIREHPGRKSRENSVLTTCI